MKDSKLRSVLRHAEWLQRAPQEIPARPPLSEVEKDLTRKTVVFSGGTDGMGRTAIERFALSSEFDGVTGKFVYEYEVRDPNPQALDDEAVERLWEVSREAVGL